MTAQRTAFAAASTATPVERSSHVTLQATARVSSEVEAGSHARIGTRIGGKYDLMRVIGQGGMGTVYEAVHAWTARRVAVKVMSPRFVSNDILVQRFLREAQAEASINHPNVVDVLDMGMDDAQTIYMALEYLEGETLARKLDREGPLSAQNTARILLPAMGALDAAHANGVLHRDVKPDNIFLSVDGAGNRVTKLLDFGVAHLVCDSVEPSFSQGVELVGTPHYMSPEQVTGRLDLDPTSDVWSMGVVLYECMGCLLPFDGDTPHAVFVAIMSGDHTPLAEMRPDLTPEITSVVERAIASDPTARFATMRELGIALATACELPHP